MAFQTGGVIHALAFAGDDAGGVVLNDGGHGGNGQGIVTDQGRGHGVLERDTELGLAGAHQDFRAVLRRLDHFHIQACIGKIAFGHGDVEAGVVGIGRPVQHEGDGLEILLGIVAGGSGLIALAAAAGAQAEYSDQGQHSGQQLFITLHREYPLFQMGMTHDFSRRCRYGMHRRSASSTRAIRAREMTEIRMITANILSKA